MKKVMKWALLSVALSYAPIAYADTADGDAVNAMGWDEIVEMARGSEVNWFLWGGADNINQYVSDYIGGILKDQYDITLNRVGVSDTVEVVNIVLGEREAGVNDNGSVDMIWINGENFRTMMQGDMVYCGYTDILPNNELVNWDNPAIANDFGVPVEGCEVPWSRAQFAFAYDSARTENPPKSIGELIDWVKENPGQFTYPAPPDFNGAVFVRHVFYYAAGGADQLLGPFDQAKFDEVAAKTWKILNDMEPYLWREGQTYPTSINAMQQLFANQEVALYFNYEPSQFGIAVQDGTFPESVRSYGLTDGTIGNTNYTLIPYNSPNKAAALVLQNVLLSGEAQYEKARPDVWGTSPAIEVDRTSPEIQAEFASIVQPESVVSSEELGKAALPELQASWISAIEQGWLENVGR
ncbi:ABC transporter substrate-binding protein [Devosia algicola]|uniref:ABC transporter substrate-binding protein n=1 Tax=Devosia algicola TaxID=3026418 RepID=A0ABY7YNV2_9HYPH|nr:ABC transporter substrate-binding protein [Devosia algicola]WDR02872.1 ABC transporter substrate-binding protein [Devosia algicola]